MKKLLTLLLALSVIFLAVAVLAFLLKYGSYVFGESDRRRARIRGHGNAGQQQNSPNTECIPHGLLLIFRQPDSLKASLGASRAEVNSLPTSR